MRSFFSTLLYLVVTVNIAGYFAPARAQLSTGDVLVIDQLGSANLLGGVLFKVDANTGQRTVLSDFNDANQGALGVNPWGVAIASSGNILVIDFQAGTSGGGALFSVDATTGQRTVVSDFNDASQGALGVNPADVAVGTSGNILIIDAGDFGGGVSGRLFSVDAATGQRTVLSDFGDANQGALGVSLVGVAVVPPDFGILLTNTRCSPASFSA